MKQFALELTPEEAKQESPAVAETMSPAYPWGTCLHLEEETLKVLKVKKMPETGVVLALEGVVKVTGWSENERIGPDGVKVKCRCLDLQFVTIGFGPAPAKEDGLGAKIYGKAMSDNG